MPQALATHLRSRGVTLLTPAKAEVTPATPIMVVEPTGSPATRAPIIAGRRLAVLHPDPGSADALAQALRAKGAEVVALSLNPDSLERAEALDPDAVLMELADFYGSCWEIARAILQHPRLKFATLLLLSPERAGGYAQDTPDIPSICFAVQSVSAEYQKLQSQARERDAFSLTLDGLGPARALRLLIETNRSFRARFVCGELTFEVDVTEGIIAGAQGTMQSAANDVYLGVHALALLMAQDRGQVEVRKVDHPAATNVMAPLDTALHLARHAGAVAKPRVEATPAQPAANHVQTPLDTALQLARQAGTEAKARVDNTVDYAVARPSRPTPREGWTAVSKPEAQRSTGAVLRPAARSPDSTIAFEPRAHMAKAVPIVKTASAATPSGQDASKPEASEQAPDSAAASSSTKQQAEQATATSAKTSAEQVEAHAKAKGGEMNADARDGKKAPQTSPKAPAAKAASGRTTRSLRPAAASAQPARADQASASPKRTLIGTAPKLTPQAGAPKPEAQKGAAAKAPPQGSAPKPAPQASASKPASQGSAPKPAPQAGASKPASQGSAPKPPPQASASKAKPQGSAPKPAPVAPKKTLVGLPAPKLPQAQAPAAASSSNEAPAAPAQASAMGDDARRSLANAPTEPPPQGPLPEAPPAVVIPRAAAPAEAGESQGAPESAASAPQASAAGASVQGPAPVLPADTSERNLALALDRTIEVSDSAVVEVAPPVEAVPEPFSLRAPSVPERKRPRWLLIAPPLAIVAIAGVLIARGASEASGAEAPAQEQAAAVALAASPEAKAPKDTAPAKPDERGTEAKDEKEQAPPKPEEASAEARDEAEAADEEPDTADEADAEDKAAAQRAGELVSQANKLRKRKKYALAKKHYNEALAIYPNYPRALTGLTQIALAQNDRKQAIALARQLVRVRPNQASAHLLLGDVYKAAGMLKDAQASWKTAARLGSTTARNRLKGR